LKCPHSHSSSSRNSHLGSEGQRSQRSLTVSRRNSHLGSEGQRSLTVSRRNSLLGLGLSNEK
jgi:hypothetical protein